MAQIPIYIAKRINKMGYRTFGGEFSMVYCANLGREADFHQAIPRSEDVESLDAEYIAAPTFGELIDWMVRLFGVSVESEAWPSDESPVKWIWKVSALPPAPSKEWRYISEDFEDGQINAAIRGLEILDFI